MRKYRIIEIKGITDESGNDCILVSANPIKQNAFSINVDSDTCHFVFPDEDRFRLPLMGIANARETWTPNIMADFVHQRSMLNGNPINMFIHVDKIRNRNSRTMPIERNIPKPPIVNFKAVELGLSVKWADKNYKSAEGDEYFDWYYARGIERVVPGWRLPTKSEVEELIIYRTWHKSSDGGYDIYMEFMGEKLHLNAAGYMDGNECRAKGEGGSYWTSSRYDSEQAYYLFFNQNFQYTDYYLKTCKFAIRLVSIY